MPPKFIKRVLCGMKGHWLVHIRNIYGDEINYRGGKRSVWRCHNCGAVRLRGHLYYEVDDEPSAPIPRCLGLDCVCNGSCPDMKKEPSNG